jgi:hypothetical protein
MEKQYSVMGESRFRIYVNWIISAKNKDDAIAKFKSEKKGVQKVKAREI